MTPTDKDLAEFARLGLEYKLLGLPNLVAWGDEVIESRDDPPTWALDLSMVPNVETAVTVLNEMQWERGTITPGLATEMLAQLTRREWVFGKIGWRIVLTIFWNVDFWSVEMSVGRCANYRLLASQLSYYSEEFEGGNMTERQINDAVDDFFWELNTAIAPLPTWV